MCGVSASVELVVYPVMHDDDRCGGHADRGSRLPRNWPEFLSFFPDEEACLRYLERVRWPDGFRCPSCCSGQAWRTKRGLWACSSCGRQTSATAGTLLAGTRTPLVSWFMSIWQLTNQKHGLSAMGLQRLLGLRSYETAWAHMHKLRRAMVRPGRDPLIDVVEVDESYVGGEESGVDGRQTFAKTLVICAVEVRANDSGREYAGRIRMSRIPSASRPPIEEFILNAVERGTRVRTDGLPSYRSLHGLGYAHDPIVVSRTGAERLNGDAPRAPRLRAAQTLAAWHLPRRRPIPPTRLLPRRIHVPLQPPPLTPPRPAVLPAAPRGRRDRTDPAQATGRRTPRPRRDSQESRPNSPYLS